MLDRRQLRPAGADAGVDRAEAPEAGGEDLAAELAAAVGRDALEAPAGRGEVLRDPPGERAGMPGVGVVRRDVQLGPGEGGGGIDRRVLPDHAFGAGEAADAEAVQLHELAGVVHGDVALGLGLTCQLRWGGVAGEQRKAQGPRTDAVAAQYAPDAVGGDPEAAPLLAGELAAMCAGP